MNFGAAARLANQRAGFCGAALLCQVDRCFILIMPNALIISVLFHIELRPCLPCLYYHKSTLNCIQDWQRKLPSWRIPRLGTCRLADGLQLSPIICTTPSSTRSQSPNSERRCGSHPWTTYVTFMSMKAKSSPNVYTIIWRTRWTRKESSGSGTGWFQVSRA